MLTWVYRDLFKSLPWVLFSVPLWSGMRDCMVILCLPLEEPPNCFPQPLWHFTYPPATQEGSSFFTSLPTFSSWPCQWVWCVKSKVNQLYIHTHVYAVDELHLTLCSPRRVACQAPLSVGFFRQEYWSGLPFPPRRNLPNPRMEPESLKSPALQVGSLLLRAIREFHTYTYISCFFFGFPSHLGHHRALSRTPCTVQQVLTS